MAPNETAATPLQLARQALRGVGVAYTAIGVTFASTSIASVNLGGLRVALGALAFVFVCWGLAHWITIPSGRPKDDPAQRLAEVGTLLAAENVLAAVGTAIGIALVVADLIVQPGRNFGEAAAAVALLLAAVVGAWFLVRVEANPERTLQNVLFARVGPLIVLGDARVRLLDDIEAITDHLSDELRQAEALEQTVHERLETAIRASENDAKEALSEAVKLHARRIGLIYYVQDVQVARLNRMNPLDVLQRHSMTARVPLPVLPLYAVYMLAMGPLRISSDRNFVSELAARIFLDSVNEQRTNLDINPFDQSSLAHVASPEEVVDELIAAKSSSNGVSRAQMDKILHDWYPVVANPLIHRDLIGELDEHRQTVATLRLSWGLSPAGRDPQV